MHPMEKSFSLAFNPMMNVKSIKDYEEEIDKLRAENFELKARLTHAPSNNNLPKILYEQNEQFERLEQGKMELLRQNEELQRALAQTANEKAELESRYNSDVVANNERMALLEEENKRLLHRIERSNKESNETYRMKELLKEAERLNLEYKNYIQNEENKREQERFEYSKQIDILQSQVAELRIANEQNKNVKLEEVKNLQRMLDVEMNRNKSNNLIISDMKVTLSNEIKEKNRLRDEVKEMEGMRTRANRMEEYLRRQEREGGVYLAGMERFKKIISEKIVGVRGKLDGLLERVRRIESISSITRENKVFLEKVKVDGTVNQIISGLKMLLGDAIKKIDVLKREAKDSVIFAKNSKNQQHAKTMLIIEEFKRQFTAAKSELVDCRKYLEKKAVENKELKNENARLQRELSARKLSAVGFGGANPLRL